MNVAAPLLEVLAADPARPAVCEPNGRTITYQELSREVVGLAGYLQDWGLAPGDRVILQVPNGVEFAASALAVLLAGGVPVLLEPGFGKDVYLSRIRAADPKWWLVHPLLIWLNRLPGATALLRRREIDVPPLLYKSKSITKVTVRDTFLQSLARESSEPRKFHPVPRDSHDDGILVFTGGTTSLPKGVRLSHGALTHYLANIADAVAGMELNNFLADTPQQVLYALRLGKTAYITKGRTKKRARYVRHLIQMGKIDAYFGSPFVWMEMMAQAGLNRTRLPASLKTVLLGGAPVTREFLQKLQNWLHPDTRAMIVYGMTEVGPVCVVTAENKLVYQGEGDLVGSPLGQVEIEIDKEKPEDLLGEVVVLGPSLYSGYLGQPERPASEGLRTGDLGRIIEHDGKKMLVLMGREKDMIIRNGVNIYPVSLEPAIRALTDHQGRAMLRECALVGLWNTDRQDEDVVLCVQPDPQGEFDEEFLEKEVKSICGSAAKPDHIVLVDPIPVTGRQNKVDKKTLREHCAQKLGYPARGGRA